MKNYQTPVVEVVRFVAEEITDITGLEAQSGLDAGFEE